MFRRFSSNSVKTWFKFQNRNKDGVLENFRVFDLTKDLVDDFVDFQINYYARNEVTHQMAGAPFTNEALNEYKDILMNTCYRPPYYTIVCCPEVDGNVLPKIVGTCTLRLYNNQEIWGYPKAKTKEVNRLFQIIQDWDNLCSVSDVMKKYGVDNAFNYYSTAVHPDYCRRGIATKINFIRYELCKNLNVGLCFGWATSEGTKKFSEKNGWISEFKVTSEEIENLFKVSSQNRLNQYHFIIYRL